MNRRPTNAAKTDAAGRTSANGPEEGAHGPAAPNLESELASCRQSLEQMRAEFQAFAYSVSHDLRAPLRAIEGFSRILLDDHESELSPAARTYLKHVVSGSQNLSGLLDDLLRFYRAGKQVPTKIAVDADRVCKEALLALGADASKSVALTQHELPNLCADPVQLREIFSLLLANALKFTSKTTKPSIEIGFKTDAKAVTFYVRDNGAGFDPRGADRLFQVFQKLHPASEYPGNGIGLAIVRRLVEAQGGCVSAHAEPGKGATFCFSLPFGNERLTSSAYCAAAIGP